MSSNEKSSDEDENMNQEEYVLFEDDILPSTLLWSQTLESITLQIKVNHVQVMITENYLKLSTKNRNITLPLYSSLYIEQLDIKQMTDINSKLLEDAVSLTLDKEFAAIWPHLLMQQTDQEVTNYLLEANFLMRICYNSFLPVAIHQYDTLDFETVINGHGQKTGLE